MEARSKATSAPVLPHSFALHRSHSPTRHFHCPSSSSAFNFTVHRTLSPTRATFSGAPSYSSSASTAAASSINLSFDKSTSQVRAARLPISPKGGAAMKSIPCAPPRKTSKCKEVCHDEFAGKDRRCRRRMGEKSSHCSHSPIKPPHAKEILISATAQQALPYDHCPRCLLKFASDRPRSQLQFWPLCSSFSNDRRILKERSVCIVAEQNAVFFSVKDFMRSCLDKKILYKQQPFGSCTRFSLKKKEKQHKKP